MVARRLITSGLIALASFAGTGDVHAQRPDFSGVWVQVLDSATERPSVAAAGDAAFRRGDMGSGWGSPLTIRQTGDSLIVAYPHFSTYDLQPPLRFAFALNGSESRGSVMIGHAPSELRSRASWSGDTLVIVTTFPALAGADRGTSPMRQALTLDAGGMLSLTTTRDGSTVRTSYRKR